MSYGYLVVLSGGTTIWRVREEGLDGMNVDNFRSQVDCFVFSFHRRVIVLASGRLLNLGTMLRLTLRIHVARQELCTVFFRELF